VLVAHGLVQHADGLGQRSGPYEGIPGGHAVPLLEVGRAQPVPRAGRGIQNLGFVQERHQIEEGLGHAGVGLVEEHGARPAEPDVPGVEVSVHQGIRNAE